MPPARRNTPDATPAEKPQSDGAVDPNAADAVTADNVVDGSTIEKVPADEKAGPRSVQSREIRQDERESAE